MLEVFGEVRTRDLAPMLRVAKTTVARDLGGLVAEGSAVSVRGGARLPRTRR